LLLVLSCLAVIALLLPFGRFLRPGSRPRSASAVTPEKQISKATLLAGYGKLPLTFEQNQGQTDARVKFLARGSGYTVFLTGDETATLRFVRPSDDRAGSHLGSRRSSTGARPAKNQDATIELSLLGANQHASIEGADLQPGRSNYFIGNDPARWQRNVPHYARVKYRDVYPGVDLVYYGNQGRLESDYILAPGADPSRIGLEIKGAGAVKLDSEGALVLRTAAGDVVLHKPFAYQETSEGRREVAANFVQHGPHLVGFHVAPYDTRQPLIIDPAVFYSTYLGGTGKDVANAIAVDAAGHAYVTGLTLSTNFPTKGPLSGQGTFLATAVNSQETFIAKLDTNGSGAGSLIYSTYLGGTGSAGFDQGAGIAVNANGEAFVVGTTGASDFPTNGVVNPFQSGLPNTSGVAFLTQLDAAGSGLLYSTYLGGNGKDNGLGIALDPTGIAYVTGVTTSTNFPVSVNPTPFQSSNGVSSTIGTAFITKIDTTKPGNSGLIYSTYLGGSGGEQANAITVDSSGNAYVTGETQSTDFPKLTSPAPFQAALAASSAINAFVAQIDTTVSGPTGLVYSTYLGGTGSTSGGGDQGNGIALDSSKRVYVVGTTGSNNFPVSATALQATSNNQGTGLLHRQAFVACFDTTKSGANSLVYSTYLGGSGSLGEEGLGIAVDSLQQAYVSGFTTSNDFPGIASGAPQSTRQGQNAFIAILNKTGTAPLAFSTFWGGSAVERGKAIALDTLSPPNIYLAGDTSSDPASPYLPSATAFQNTRGGSSDAFVTRFSGTASGPDFTVSVAPASSTIAAGASANFTVTVTSVNGFNAAVDAACTGAPPGSSCTLTPTSVTPVANATATINGVIATSARTLAPPPLFFRAPPRFPVWLWGFMSMVLAILAAWAATRRTRKLAFGFGVLALLALTGCSGPLQGGTPAGSYTVTVTATSGSLTHPANYTLTVN